MKKNALFMMILAGIGWGTSGIFVNLLSPFGLTSMQMVTVRAAVSAIVMLIYTLIRDRKIFRVNGKDFWIFVALGVSLFFTCFFYYQAMQMTSIATAVSILYTDPIFVVAFSVLFLGEKFSKTKLLSIIGIITGGALVSGIADGIAFDGVGILFAIGSSVMYAVYNVLTKIAMMKKARAESTTLYSFIAMAVVGLCLCKPLGIFQAAAGNPFPVIPLLILLGIITFVIPYTLFTLSMKQLPAGVVSALGIMEPLSATLFGIAFFSEELTVFSIIGIVLILTSVIFIGKETN